MTGCLRPSPTDNFFILASIQLTEIRHEIVALFLARRAQEPEHLLYEKLPFPLGEQLRQLKSRHSFVTAALKMLNDLAQSGTSVAGWAEYRWSIKWRENATRFYTFIKDVIPTPPGFSFSRSAWVRLNRPRNGVDLFRSERHKWGMAFTAACECGGKEQAAEHVRTSCPIYHHPNGARALSDVNKNLTTWLLKTCLAI